MSDAHTLYGPYRISKHIVELIAPHIDGKEHKILVVDDEKEIARSLHDLLRLKYQVIPTTSGKEALAVMTAQDVSVIICDQRMPELEGVQVLEECYEKWPDCVRILLTGYADIRAVVAAINDSHVYCYIAKPWDVESLLTSVSHAIAINTLTRRINVAIDRARVEV